MALYETPYKNIFGGASKEYEVSYGKVYGFKESKPDLNEFETLKNFATELGYEKKEGRSTFQKISRILNKDIAFLSGAVYGVFNPDVSIGKSIKMGLDKNWGFADVVRNLGYNPESRGGKIVLGAGGFAADVLFSPLTYLSFGAATATKVGAKTLTKTGVKFAQKATKESVETLSSKMISEGVDEVAVHGIVEKMAKKNVDNLFRKALTVEGGIKKMSQKTIDKLLNRGMSMGTIEDIAKLGPSLISQGGIRWAGKTLVTSKTLAKTPFGKAARAIGETKTLQALKDDFGKMFVYGFKQNPKVMSIMEKGNIYARRSVNEVNEFVEKTMGKVPQKKLSEFFDQIFQHRSKTVKIAKQLEEESIEKFNKLFPTHKITDKSKAISTFERVQDVAKKQTTQIQTTIKKLGKNITDGETDTIQTTIKELRLLLKVKKSTTKSTMAEISNKEYQEAIDFVLGIKKESLVKTLDNLEKRIAKGIPEITKEVAEKGAKVTTKGLDEVGKIAILKKELDTITKTLAKGQNAIDDILSARRQAKKLMRDVKIDWKGDKQLAQLDELFFQGDDSIMAQNAKLAGMSEADTFSYYISTTFKDQSKIKKFANPNLSAGDANYLKEFGASEAVAEAMRKSPKAAMKRTLLQTRINKIKFDTLDQTLQSVGKPLSHFADKAIANKAGYQKFSKEMAGLGKIEGWIPKDIIKNMDEFLVPRSNLVNSLGKSLGFDYATGIFKGYVTTLFPGFHFRNMTSNQFLLMTKLGVDYANPDMQKAAFNMWLGAGFPKRFGKNLDMVITTKTGVKKRLGDIIDAIKKESDILDKGAFSDAEQLIEDIQKTGKLFKETLNPLARRNIALEKGRAMGTLIENQAKMTGIMSGVIEGKTIKESIKIAEDAIFNYGKLTSFEKDIMRRIIPFYTFARKNMEFQAKMLAKYPGRSAAQLKFIRGFGASVGEPISGEDEAGLPSWMIDSLGIKAGTNKYGQSRFLTGLGLPIEEFISRFTGEKGFVWNTIASTMQQMNPVLKVPMERGIGVDFFRGRPIIELDNAGDWAALMDMMPEAVSKELKKFTSFQTKTSPIYVEGKKVGEKDVYSANPFFLHWLRNIPTTRISATAGYLSDDEQTAFDKYLRVFTGVRGWSIDQERQKFYNELAEKEEIINFLDKMGVAGKKDIIYIRDNYKK